jgi:hypothetical protein
VSQQDILGLTPKQAERLQDLDELIELGEELDEDEKAERTWLRLRVRFAKQKSIALAKWDKAETVLCLWVSLSSTVVVFYALTQQAVQNFVTQWSLDASDYSVVSVDRRTLPDGIDYDVSQDIYVYDDGPFTQE